MSILQKNVRTLQWRFRSSFLLVLSLFATVPMHAAARSSRGNKALACRRAGFKRFAQLQVEFSEAVSSYDPHKLQQVLRKGADPNVRSPEGMTSLVHVILYCTDEKKRVRLVDLLLKNKADPNLPVYSKTGKDKRDHLGLYPLHAAVWTFDKQVLKLLLDAKARVNVFTEQVPSNPAKSIVSPLLSALLFGPKVDAEIVRMLLNAGAQTQATVEDLEQTPLHLAVVGGDILSIAYLLHAGADTMQRDAVGLAPIHHAVIRNDICALWMLSKKSDIDLQVRHPDAKMHSHIMSALKCKKKERARLKDLVGKYSVEHEGYTPLHYAFIKPSCEMLDALLALGANPNATSWCGFTPLHIAASTIHETIPDDVVVAWVERLLAAGARPNVWAYMEHEGDLDYATPLHLSLRIGRDRVFDCLYAYYRNNELKVDESKATIPDTIIGFKMRRRERRLQLLEQCMQLGADINSVDKRGHTLLHLAAIRKENIAIVRFLIDQGVDIHARTCEGFTAYDFALCRKKKHVVELLKSYEAARLDRQLEALPTSFSLVSCCSQLDERIGDTSRLPAFEKLFATTPGFYAVCSAILRHGSTDAIDTLPSRSRYGAVNNAKGALFELQAAYHLMLERQTILGFRRIYDGLEYDIETRNYLVECKNILWKRRLLEESEELKDFFIRHQTGAHAQAKQFVIYSYRPIPDDWKQWFNAQRMCHKDYNEIVATA